MPDFSKEELYAALVYFFIHYFKGNKAYNGEDLLGFIDELHQKLIKLLLQEVGKRTKFEAFKEVEDYPYIYLAKYLEPGLVDELLLNFWTEYVLDLISYLKV